MFDYTKDYLYLLKRDFKRVDIAFTIINVLITIVYPIFAMIVQIGNLYVNICVLALAVLYGLIQLILGSNKKFKVNRIYAWLRILLSTVSLGINIYSIYIAATNLNGIAIMLASTMTIFWILKVLLNLLYDIFAPRFETLFLCIKEDSKPYARKLDKVSRFIKLPPVFDYCDEETPEVLLEMAKKSQKVSDNLKEDAIDKEVNEKFQNIIDEADINIDGFYDIRELIIQGLSNETVVVNKDRFFHQEFATTLDKETSKIYLEDGPKKANLTPEQLADFAEKIRVVNEDDAAVVIKYLNDDAFDYRNPRLFKKVLKSFFCILTTMQKIIYVYGFDQIETKEKLSEKEISALVLALSIALNDDKAEEAKAGLLELKKFSLKNALANFAIEKINFLKEHSEDIRKFLAKSIPVIGEIVAMYSTGKVGLITKVAAQVIQVL